MSGPATQPGATTGGRAVELTLAEPVLLAMSPQRREAVVAALAELLAADLDQPAAPRASWAGHPATGDPPD